VHSLTNNESYMSFHFNYRNRTDGYWHYLGHDAWRSNYKIAEAWKELVDPLAIVTVVDDLEWPLRIILKFQNIYDSNNTIRYYLS